MSSGTDDDAEILAAARAGFLEEAQEMLRQYEAALLVLESDPADGEQLNAAFRAAHTIKGGAGMFGLDDVVREVLAAHHPPAPELVHGEPVEHVLGEVPEVHPHDERRKDAEARKEGVIGEDESLFDEADTESKA